MVGQDVEPDLVVLTKVRVPESVLKVELLVRRAADGVALTSDRGKHSSAGPELCAKHKSNVAWHNRCLSTLLLRAAVWSHAASDDDGIDGACRHAVRARLSCLCSWVNGPATTRHGRGKPRPAPTLVQVHAWRGARSSESPLLPRGLRTQWRAATPAARMRQLESSQVRPQPPLPVAPRSWLRIVPRLRIVQVYNHRTLNSPGPDLKILAGPERS